MVRLFRMLASGGDTITGKWSELFAAASDGDQIVIAAGEVILYDMPSSPNYGAVEINGKLIVDQTKNTSLRYERMMISGSYIAGTEAAPFPRDIKHESSPTGAQANEVSLADPRHAVPDDNRGIMVMPGGEISWVADVPDVVIFKLAQTAAVGATSLTADRPVTFKAGDVLEVGTTMYWQEGMSDSTAAGASAMSRQPGYGQEFVTVAQDVTAGTTIQLTAPLTFRHHGQLQYLVPPSKEDVPNTNLSYTPYTIQPDDYFGTVNGTDILGSKVLSAVSAGAATVIDNRCTVGLLTHPIKFFAPDDADWQTHGYGAHMMVMGTESKCRMQGVERFRVGQAGFLGRYPDHQHMRSYVRKGAPGSGTFLGDVDANTNYTRKTSTRLSSNRGSTIHGTCGYTLYQNVYSNIDTHCIFLEDGSERRNVIDGNFVSGVRTIGYGKQVIKNHDYAEHQSDNGPSGVWYTSPDNYLRNNIIAGSYVGIWNTFSQFCVGESSDVAFNPDQTQILQHFNNESSSAKRQCMQTQGRVINDAGDMEFGFQYRDIGQGDPSVTLFEKANLWKGGAAWYRNNVYRPHYLKWTLAGLKGGNPYIGDIQAGVNGTVFDTSGGGTPALFDGGLVVTKTLDDYYADLIPHQMVTYHNSLSRTNTIFVPAPMGVMYSEHGPLARNYQLGGCLPLWDYYENMVELGFARDKNIAILGKNAGFYGVMYPPAFLIDQFGQAYKDAVPNYYMPVPNSQGIAGAKLLPDDGSLFGWVGWWVFDSPYLTYGTDGGVYAESAPSAPNLNGRLLAPHYRYYGLQVNKANGLGIGHVLTSIDTAYPVNYTRMQDDGETAVPNGTWNTPGPQINYPNMRSACILKGGIVKTGWSRSDLPLPYNFNARATGMTDPADNFTWAIDYDATVPVSSLVIVNSGGNVEGVNKHTFVPAASKADLLASTVCKYWVDTANNLIWMRVFAGDLKQIDSPLLADYAIYRAADISCNGG